MQIRFIAGMALCVIFNATVARSDDATSGQIVKRLVADWQKRQQTMRSIRVVYKGTLLYPKGKFDPSFVHTEADRRLLAQLGTIPPEDTSLAHRVDMLLDLAQSRARKEMQWHVLGVNAKFEPRHTTKYFNGTNAKLYEPRYKNTSAAYKPGPQQPDLVVYGGRNVRNDPTFFAFEDYPVLWACGSLHRFALVPGELRPSLNQNELFVHGTGQIQGRNCTVLRTPVSDPAAQAFHEYWVDQARESIILRGVGYLEGEREYQIDVDYKQQDGMWLPASWRCTYYEAGGVDRQFDLSVERIEISPAVRASDFDVELKSGMVVHMAEADQTGVVGLDDKTLLPLSAQAEVKKQKLFRSGVWYAGGLAVLIVGVWGVRRLWKKVPIR